MNRKIDTAETPWLFTPHSEGELDEYFNSGHEKAVADTAKEIIASLTEIRDRLSGEICYELNYNQRRYKYTILRFADMIIRADVTIKHIKSALFRSEMENQQLKSKIKELERKMNHESADI